MKAKSSFLKLFIFLNVLVHIVLVAAVAADVNGHHRVIRSLGDYNEEEEDEGGDDYSDDDENDELSIPTVPSSSLPAANDSSSGSESSFTTAAIYNASSAVIHPFELDITRNIGNDSLSANRSSSDGGRQTETTPSTPPPVITVAFVESSGGSSKPRHQHGNGLNDIAASSPSTHKSLDGGGDESVTEKAGRHNHKPAKKEEKDENEEDDEDYSEDDYGEYYDGEDEDDDDEKGDTSTSLDNVMSRFFHNAAKVLRQSYHIFSEEMNKTHTDNSAANIWIGWHNSVQRIMASLMNQAVSSAIDSVYEINISHECTGALLKLGAGIKTQKKWAMRRK